MIHHFPQQPQSHRPPFGHAPSHGPQNPLAASARAMSPHNSGTNEPRINRHQQLPQFPQQYALPLQRKDLRMKDESLQDEGYKSQAQPENMLRRKTPNGILNASYDATTVEPAGRTHAMKHILLPVTAPQQAPMLPLTFPSGLQQELPLRSPGLSLSNIYSSVPQQGWAGSNEWNFGFQSPFELWRGGWSRSQSQLPQIDSMLNQVPSQHAQAQHLYNAQQYPGLMPPPLQNAARPTTSNEHGPYGPYWPNGTFVPYRPAALRDSHYYPHAGSDWTLQSPYGGVGLPVKSLRPLNGIASSNDSFYGGHITMVSAGNTKGEGHRVDAVTQGVTPPHGFHREKLLVPRDVYDVDAGSTYTNGEGLQPGLGLSHAVNQQSVSLSSSGQSTPSEEQPPPFPALSEFGPQSDNAALREKVFTWAHAIYVDLLKYLHHTRRNGTNGRPPNSQQSSQRLNFYPKPPRQPGSDFSSLDERGPSIGRAHHALPPVQRTSAGQLAFEPLNHDSPRRSLGHDQAPASSQWVSQAAAPLPALGQCRLSWQQQQPHSTTHQPFSQQSAALPTLRRTSGTSMLTMSSARHDVSPVSYAQTALESLTVLCKDSSWQWIEGMLLGGSLAYALGEHEKASKWYSLILEIDPNHVEAISNLAATFLALNRRQDAEHYWLRAIKLRPSYFEAVEHLVGLLCADHKNKQAVQIIDLVERSLQYAKNVDLSKDTDRHSDRLSSPDRSTCASEASDKAAFDFDGEIEVDYKDCRNHPSAKQPGFGSSGYAIPGLENGRILQLIHAKGNMLYSLGDNVGAAKAFESAVLVGTGRNLHDIGGLMKHILAAVTTETLDYYLSHHQIQNSTDPVLLPPEKALTTARLCFPSHGDLPGLKYVPYDSMARRAAISTTSNSLLSLAKIFQDGMASNSPKATAYQTAYGVREILALYYLSLSLQPSPSTANNVGILLASVQQTVPSKQLAACVNSQVPRIPGVVPGSGIALALAYYNYGLNLDSRHAHLFTNLGSLLKDIGQLSAAIKMYEQAVACDANFDIALANLANAVKDQGRTADAIGYYKRAVNASPDFAEAVCGLANALNSVCGWQGRGGIAADGGRRDRWHVDEKGMLLDAKLPGAKSSGWVRRVVDLVEKQLADGETWGRGLIDATFTRSLIRLLPIIDRDAHGLDEKEASIRSVLNKWTGQKWEGARIVKLAERMTKRLGWQWYQDMFIRNKPRPETAYARPHVPSALTVPAAPTVLPFHTFTCPMSAKQIRLISQRNGLRISCSTLKAPWLPPIVYRPPAPPSPYLKVGYVSSDFNNHPLAHLMQSVFGMHDPRRVKAYCYATTPSDHSVHRQQIEREAPVFHTASTWPVERLVKQIVEDGIHILVNLNGYTRGARNEVFAARPAPIHMSFMGFAGTLGAEWCDYLLADETAVPPDTLRPWRRNVDLEDQMVDDNIGGDQDDWVYGENIIFCRNTFFCCDHRQSAPDSQGKQLDWDEEQKRRWSMRKEIFPHLPDNVIILGNFNQLYKIEPTTFRTWLRILSRLPNAILWLLRFPDLGETHLRQTAVAWAGEEVASRILFTDVAPKAQHISRARVCDLFLDTPECNAHTTAADVLWSGTPLLTLPRYGYKMCSRMAASILKGALPRSEEGRRAAGELIVASEDEYEEVAVRLAKGCTYNGYRIKGRLGELRRVLYEARWSSALFDTRRWVRDLEGAYWIAWKRWVGGVGGDIWLEKELKGR